MRIPLMMSIIIVSAISISSASASYTYYANATSPPIFSGYTGFLTLTNNGIYVEVHDGTGLGDPNNNGYYTWNITDYCRQYKYHKISNVYVQHKIRSLTGISASEGFNILRITPMTISNESTIFDINNNISVGYIVNTTKGLSVGQEKNWSVNGVSIFGNLTFYDIQTRCDNGSDQMFFSFAYTEAMADGDDITLNATPGGYNSNMFIEHDCRPPSVRAWFVNDTCNINDENLTLWGNVTILRNGYLNLTRVNFTWAIKNTTLKIQPGGKIALKQTQMPLWRYGQ